MATETKPVFSNGKEHTRHHLSAREKFLFQSYLQKHYVESKLGDPDFAVQASSALNLPISQAMVSYARREFDIPANRVTGSAAVNSRAEILSRLEALEARVETLLRERREHFHRSHP